MQQDLAATDTLPVGSRHQARSRRLVIATVLALAIAVAGAAIAAAAGRRFGSHNPAPPAAVITRDPVAAVTPLPGTPAATAAGLASELLARAPAVVVTGAGGPGVDTAAIASRAHAPLLLAPAPGSAADQAALLAAVRSLRPMAVLAAGVSVRALAKELPGIKVVASARILPATKPLYVIGVGAGFTSQPLLAARVAVAETGVQLPGGGQVLFPGREIVGLYGTPLDPALGALGQQDLQASIARAKTVAAQYYSISNAPVVPAFEIIATVATARPGTSGMYSQVISPAALQPWVEAAANAGLYVTLDLQPGRASLLAQAEVYQSLRVADDHRTRSGAGAHLLPVSRSG